MIEEPAELTDLRRLAARVANRARCDTYEVMMELGFELLELQDFGYHCTPVNALAFGATGGDGVHLSLLEGAPCDGAVVVTVPVGDVPNTVVAESFVEFLRLGYFNGFAWLEELGYAANRDLQASYTRAPDGISKPGRQLLTEVRTHFGLRPFEDVCAHFLRLKHYTDQLRLPDPEEWAKRHGV